MEDRRSGRVALAPGEIRQGRKVRAVEVAKQVAPLEQIREARNLPWRQPLGHPPFALSGYSWGPSRASGRSAKDAANKRSLHLAHGDVEPLEHRSLPVFLSGLRLRLPVCNCVVGHTSIFSSFDPVFHNTP